MGKSVSKSFGVDGYIPEAGNGPYKCVGSFLIRFPGSTRAKIFYPAQGESKLQSKHYIRKEAVQGMADVAGSSKFFLSNLVKTKHHISHDADPLHHEDGYPLIIFSHGLKSTLELYTKTCIDLASYGYIVVATEHEDGSAAYCKKEGADEFTPYQRDPESLDLKKQDEVIEYRASFLEHRKEELVKLLAFLKEPHHREEYPVLVNEFFAEAKISDIILAGHSFGACTAVYALDDEEFARNISACVLLDIWTLPLPKDIIERGVSKPCVNIISDHFRELWWAPITKELVENSKSMESYYIPGTRHEQFSDVPWLFKGKAKKLTNSEGKTSVEESHEAVIHTLSSFLQNSDFKTENAHSTLQPFP